jgi:hypothetical protein
MAIPPVLFLIEVSSPCALSIQDFVVSAMAAGYVHHMSAVLRTLKFDPVA